jgi:hypothetical protein
MSNHSNKFSFSKTFNFHLAGLHNLARQAQQDYDEEVEEA